jgi:hypothetical protein
LPRWSVRPTGSVEFVPNHLRFPPKRLVLALTSLDVRTQKLSLMDYTLTRWPVDEVFGERPGASDLRMVAA